ncbi:MAG: NAD-dependent epimerase/dehydratase family protein [Chloroflexi bacterium]|nr:NAD-dependent epimerase/dehydratase family protein [Chloroflexota bacterium]
MDLAGKTVLVTGAGGFIGGRVAERLQEQGAHVRGMVRTSAKSGDNVPALAETIVGDVTDENAVRRAASGCSAVVHCAARQGARAPLDEFRRVNVGGTLNLLREAERVGIRRFVHLSTINVHGYPPPPNANADSPLVFKGDAYSLTKAEGERAAWDYVRERAAYLELVVIRPACTYGPRSEAWTLQPLRRVRRRVPVLLGGGSGICNAVYIDNLVDLILLALTHDAAAGQAFIGAEGRGVTWREFYGAYAAAAGVRNLRSIPRGAAFALAVAAEAISRITGRAPHLTHASVDFYTHRVVYDVSKARRLLGYDPRITFREGMQRTREWLVRTHQCEESRTIPDTGTE